MPALKLIALAGLISIVAAQQWGPVCEGNPTNEIRGCDKYGCGNFGAPSKETHHGVDVICSDGSQVLAPFDGGQLSGPIRPFHNGNAIDDGIKIEGGAQCLPTSLLNNSPCQTSTSTSHKTPSSLCNYLQRVWLIQCQRGTVG
uniref:Myeloid protein 1-like n=1 Tax=Crocodylus porosus TaxID=8502 RepID=A0A7M4EWF0_CROPO